MSLITSEMLRAMARRKVTPAPELDAMRLLIISLWSMIVGLLVWLVVSGD